MKKIGLLALVLIMVFSMVACGNNAGETATESESVAATESESAAATESESAGGETADVVTYKIGYAFNAVDENTQRSLDGWEAAVDAWNKAHDDIKVEFFYTDAQTNVEMQLSNVETMILEKPDAIILASVDTTGCIPAAQAIHDAGIFCVEGRGMESDAVDLHWTGFDEPSMSRLSATIYSDYLEANPDAVLNAVLMYGNPAQANQLHRMDGFLELAEQYPDRINVLDENYANWSTEEAQSLMEDWIQVYGDEINVVVSASDAMSLGAINALQGAGYNPGDVMITAVDGTEAGLDQIESGWQTATVKMLMSSQSTGQLDVIIKCLTGEYTENVYNGGSQFTALVTEENAEEYRNVD